LFAAFGETAGRFPAREDSAPRKGSREPSWQGFDVANADPTDSTEIYGSSRSNDTYSGNASPEIVSDLLKYQYDLATSM
jgi:hypothetical protein